MSVVIAAINGIVYQLRIDRAAEGEGVSSEQGRTSRYMHPLVSTIFILCTYWREGKNYFFSELEQAVKLGTFRASISDCRGLITQLTQALVNDEIEIVEEGRLAEGRFQEASKRCADIMRKLDGMHILKLCMFLPNFYEMWEEYVYKWRYYLSCFSALGEEKRVEEELRNCEDGTPFWNESARDDVINEVSCTPKKRRKRRRRRRRRGKTIQAEDDVEIIVQADGKNVPE